MSHIYAVVLLLLSEPLCMSLSNQAPILEIFIHHIYKSQKWGGVPLVSLMPVGPISTFMIVIDTNANSQMRNTPPTSPFFFGRQIWHAIFRLPSVALICCRKNITMAELSGHLTLGRKTILLCSNWPACQRCDQCLDIFYKS